MIQPTVAIDVRLLDQTTLRITGMGCEGCAATVEGALLATSGVETAVVDLRGEQATVEFDADVTSPADLAAAVKAAGYGYPPLRWTSYR